MKSKTIKINIMKEKMKAIIATGYGAPDVLKMQQVDKPQPKENDVLVKVHASSATTADGMMRTGKPYFGRLMTGITKPKHAIPGTGFAGVVENVGKKVATFKPGDRVFGETTLGFSTNAEFFTIPENGVILPMPDNMSYAEGATYGDGHVTSLNFLKEIANIKPGQKVLINGASGSLGTAAVQIAKYMDTKVTGVCSTRNVGLVKSLGADHVIDYTKKDFTKVDETYDVVYDTIGKSTFSKSKNILSESGLYVSPVLKFSLLLQMMRTSISGKKKAKFAATGLRSDGELQNMLVELVEIFKQGRLKTVIDRQYPLEKVAEAHTYIASGHKKGNVVIIVEP
ncbi:NAD(P)-dependent alcohol dehydrogenase [Maribellus maritimus]|uniref:NAD(P)-dependent alcohol dehydrogenase n=1 Tax=Maribellus maritimus TaxID=2870838 RepID=UPI001EECE710|nr:NAD(P)-dependent alcohol dehydrogenase [Maribellus maritimus]MCG6186926.1 NAD(P)-dependent alcohol dehydrogenase [Maribellus maritimus]